MTGLEEEFALKILRMKSRLQFLIPFSLRFLFYLHVF